MKNRIIAHGGSVQNVPGIPDDIKRLYKTVWEISQKTVIDMAADRGAFICQSQSLNIHLSAPTFGQLTSMHFYGWKKGLKTGTYYLRTRPAANAIQFTISAEEQAAAKEANRKASSSVKRVVSTSNGAVRVADGAAALTASVGALGVIDDNQAEAKAIAKAKAAAEAEAEKTAQLKATSSTPVSAQVDDGYAAALERQRLRQLEADKLVCSLENKEACLMCSG